MITPAPLADTPKPAEIVRHLIARATSAGWHLTTASELRREYIAAATAKDWRSTR